MIGDVGEDTTTLKTSKDSTRLSEDEYETAEALLDYYETKRGIRYGNAKREPYLQELGRFIRAMHEVNVDPLMYVNWVLSEYEPAYINMLLSKNNLKRYASSSISETTLGYYFESSKTAVRVRRDYGMDPKSLYYEIKTICDPLIVYMHTQEGGVDEEIVEDYEELKHNARVQWQVLSEDAKKDLLEFFKMDELNF